MAYTLSQLQALENAIATGHRRVTYEGKTVEYHSMEELMAAADRIRGALIDEGLLTAPAGSRGSATLAEFHRE